MAYAAALATGELPIPQVRELTRRGQAALGEEEFAAAYAKGWELDTKTAMTFTRWFGDA